MHLSSPLHGGLPGEGVALRGAQSARRVAQRPEHVRRELLCGRCNNKVEVKYRCAKIMFNTANVCGIEVRTFVAEGEAVGELLEELIAGVFRAHHPLPHRQGLRHIYSTRNTNTVTRNQFMSQPPRTRTRQRNSTAYKHNTLLAAYLDDGGAEHLAQRGVDEHFVLAQQRVVHPAEERGLAES